MTPYPAIWVVCLPGMYSMQVFATREGAEDFVTRVTRMGTVHRYVLAEEKATKRRKP